MFGAAMISGGLRRSLPRAGTRLLSSRTPPRVWRRSYATDSPKPAGPAFPTPSSHVFTWGIIGVNTLVYLGWNLASPSRGDPKEPGKYSLARLRRKLADNFKQALLQRALVQNFTLSQQNLRDGRYWTLLTSAFSHQSLDHLLFNMVAFTFVSSLGFTSGLGAGRMVILALGSTLTSGASSMLDETTRSATTRLSTGLGHAHLGASGMIEGLLVAMTLIRPQVPVYIMFIPIAIPLWVAAGGFVAWDYYHLMRERETGSKRGWMSSSYVGYAAHLGGAVFGAGYYLLRLRYRFGGVLPAVRK